jgi:hypothetical protein
MKVDVCDGRMTIIKGREEGDIVAVCAAVERTIPSVIVVKSKLL